MRDLKELMHKHKVDSNDVAVIVGRSVKTVHIWRSPRRDIPANIYDNLKSILEAGVITESSKRRTVILAEMERRAAIVQSFAKWYGHGAVKLISEKSGISYSVVKAVKNKDGNFSLDKWNRIKNTIDELRPAK